MAGREGSHRAVWAVLLIALGAIVGGFFRPAIGYLKQWGEQHAHDRRNYRAR